jgi:mono/diheme cytochrome c family protein
LRTAAFYAAVAAAASVADMTIPVAAQQPGGGHDQAQVDLGKRTYAHNCSHCHGPNMVNAGTVTPDLRAFPDPFRHRLEAVCVEIIKNPPQVGQ